MQICLLGLDGEVLSVGTFNGSGHELLYKSQKQSSWMSLIIEVCHEFLCPVFYC